MNHNQVPCSVCKNLFNKKSLIPSELLRPEILDLIRSKEVAWTPAPICRNCLDIFRNQWIDQLMQREKGELTAIEEAVVKSFKDQLSISENINEQYAEKITFGQRVADQMASFGGSWTFILLFIAGLWLWILFNSYGPSKDIFDPFPFILLNLILSCIAAIQAPIIMMSQNRQEQKDRLRNEHDYQVNLKAELEIRELHLKLDQLMSEHWRRLIEIQQAQIEMLNEQTEMMKRQQ